MMKYPFKVYPMKVDDHAFWVAESLTLKGCVGQGDTIEVAQKELENNEIEWVAAAKELDMDIPPVPIQSESAYSGKFTVRVSPYVHEEAVEMAKEQNISLNQYVNDAIVAQNSRYSVTKYVFPEIQKAVESLKAGLSIPIIAASSGTTMVTMWCPSEKSPYKLVK